MKANSQSLPPFPVKTGPGRTPKRSGPVPAWGLKVGSLLATLAVFTGSFTFARANVYVTNAPLQPARVTAASAIDTAATTSTASATTTLTRNVRTTTRTAVTSTKSS